MRVHTEKKDKMGRRFAVVIGVAAVGAMALGAQTAHGGIADEKQKLGKAVKVNASCGDALEGRGAEDEACTARAEGKLLWFTPVPSRLARSARPDPPTNVKHGKLKPASADVGPGETTTLKLKLTKKTRKRAGEALDDGKKVLAKVKVDATDAAGNVATAKRTIRLVK
jgi:hypothetical protein